MVVESGPRTRQLVHFWLFPGKSFSQALYFAQPHPESPGSWCWGPDGSQESTRVSHVFLFICQWPSETALLIWLERTIQYKYRLQFLFSAKSDFTRKNIGFGGICKVLLTC